MARQPSSYDRDRAVRYALRHYNDPNPLFANMDAMGGGGDCTNFTSQCLLDGGYPMDFRQTGQATEWWYRRVGSDGFDGNRDDWWSCTWSLAENQFQYLLANQGWAVDLLGNPRLARELSLGDIIYYDWSGDGRFNHGAIVTYRNRNGVPYVTFRTLAPSQPERHGHWALRHRSTAQRIWGIHVNDSPAVHPQNPSWNRLMPCDQARKR